MKLIKLIMGWLRASFKFPLIILMLLAGFLIVKTVVPQSGNASSASFLRIRRKLVLNWSHLTSRILNLRIKREGCPDPQAQLWVANHISWIDILALATENDLIFIAKHELSAWPVMGSIFSWMGTLFIRRGDRDAINEMSRTIQVNLEAGKTIMLFPEATTTDGATVRRFGSKLFEPAIHCHSLVQPLALRYAGDSQFIAPFIGQDSFLGHLFKVLTLKKISLIISYGPAVDPQSLSKEILARDLRLAVINLLSEYSTSGNASP